MLRYHAPNSASTGPTAESAGAAGRLLRRGQVSRSPKGAFRRASWVERARILLAYRADPSACDVGETVGVTHQTVLRYLDRAVRFGVEAALDDCPRPGKGAGDQR